MFILALKSLQLDILTTDQLFQSTDNVSLQQSLNLQNRQNETNQIALFTNSFNGNNHTISNYRNNLCFIEKCENCTIDNITFEDFIINGLESAIIHHAVNVSFQYVKIINSVFIGNQFAASLACFSYSYLNITNSVVSEIIIDAPVQGGLVVISTDAINIDKTQIQVHLGNGGGICHETSSINMNNSQLNITLTNKDSHLITQKQQGTVSIKFSTFYITVKDVQFLHILSGDINFEESGVILDAGNYTNTTVFLNASLINSFLYTNTSIQFLIISGNFNNFYYFCDNCSMQINKQTVSNNILTGGKCPYGANMFVKKEYCFHENYLKRFDNIYNTECAQFACPNNCDKPVYYGSFCNQCPYPTNNDNECSINVFNSNGNCQYESFTGQYTCDTCDTGYKISSHDNHCYPFPQCFNNGTPVIQPTQQIPEFKCKCTTGYDELSNCKLCESGYEMARGACSQVITNLDGRCFADLENNVWCEQCNPGYSLYESQCILSLPDSVITLISFNVIVFTVLIVLLTLYLCWCKQRPNLKYIAYKEDQVEYDQSWQTSWQRKSTLSRQIKKLQKSIDF